MWKILFLTFLAVALAGISQFQLKGRPRQRLQMSLEDECEKYAHKSKAEKAYDSVMTAVGCLYNDAEISDAFKKLSNVNSSETLLDAGRGICSQRKKIIPCYHRLLQVFVVCAPPSVQRQIDDLQSAFVELAEFVCTNDCRRLRDFLKDGAFECIDDKNDALKFCTANVTDLTTELPEDTTTFAAIDACYRFDSMVTCVNEVLQICPKQSTGNFMNSLFSQFRQGTYCHITLPLEKDEKLNKETKDDEEHSEENNKL